MYLVECGRCAEVDQWGHLHPVNGGEAAQLELKEFGLLNPAFVQEPTVIGAAGDSAESAVMADKERARQEALGSLVLSA